MSNKTTKNGGHIQLFDHLIDIVPREFFSDGSGFDHSCPNCLKAEPREMADFTQFGILVDEHLFVYACGGCNQFFAAEVEVPSEFDDPS